MEFKQEYLELLNKKQLLDLLKIAVDNMLLEFNDPRQYKLLSKFNNDLPNAIKIIEELEQNEYLKNI